MALINMRDDIEKFLKEYLRVVALKERERQELTQAQMAERLCMSPRSYAYIESGENLCGTLTALMLLIDCPARESILHDIEVKIQECKDMMEEKEPSIL